MLDKVLKFLHKPKSEFLICGDFNVNFLEENGHKRQLVLLLQSYNAFHTVQFPTRVTKTSSSAIDNIFLDHTRINSCNIISISNGLSDQDAQCLVINNFYTKKSQSLPGITAHIVNKESVADFLYKLSNEKWESLYKLNEVNDIFNLFVHLYVLVHETCFFKNIVTKKCKDNGWMTIGIRTSCRRKENLYIVGGNSYNYLLKNTIEFIVPY
jgi:hypothetical protein